MNYFLLLSLSLFSISSFSYFSQESKDIILDGKYNFSNSWPGTVWSSCRARRYNKVKLKADHLVVSLENNQFKYGEYLANVYINRGDLGQLKQAPVTFVMNGIFGSPDSGLVKQLAVQLLERGHHIVALGNPLGVWGLEQKPMYTIGNFVQEAEVYLDIMDRAVEWMKERNLYGQEVNVVGISHGGFISGMIKAMDAKRGAPLINGMTTLFSPPLNMGSALRNMDSILYETQSLGKLPDWALAIVSLRFCLLPPRKFIDSIQLRWAKAIFGFYGFQRSLADSSILLNELYDLGKVPTGKKEKKMWRRTFTFNDYIQDFSQDLGELMDSPYGELYYWLDQVNEDEFHTFASLDDPLNEEVSWPSADNLFLLDYGGHYGLRAFDYFDDFLYSIF